jgi:hypothetical protein
VLAAEDLRYVDDDIDSPTFGLSLPIEETGPVVLSEETVRNIRTVLAARYQALVPYLQESAAEGKALVFWAA